jgi:hypothetical protein
MIAVGATVRGFAGRLGGYLPTVTCVALMALGVFTLINRSRLDPAAIAGRVGAARTLVPASDGAKPCCDPHDR